MRKTASECVTNYGPHSEQYANYSLKNSDKHFRRPCATCKPEKTVVFSHENHVCTCLYATL